jgi:hypothetical protein
VGLNSLTSNEESVPLMTGSGRSSGLKTGERTRTYTVLEEINRRARQKVSLFTFWVDIQPKGRLSALPERFLFLIQT